jgi:hypothetical protein
LSTMTKGNRLYLFSPRIRHGQERVFDVRSITATHTPPVQLLFEHLAIFAGSFFFNENSELENYLRIVGYCPSPRTSHLADCFDRQLIEVSGFVTPTNRLTVFQNEESLCRYQADPGEFIVKLLNIRHFGIVPQTAHQLDVLSRGRRPHCFIE